MGRKNGQCFCTWVRVRRKNAGRFPQFAALLKSVFWVRTSATVNCWAGQVFVFAMRCKGCQPRLGKFAGILVWPGRFSQSETRSNSIFLVRVCAAAAGQARQVFVPAMGPQRRSPAFRQVRGNCCLAVPSFRNLKPAQILSLRCGQVRRPLEGRAKFSVG